MKIILLGKDGQVGRELRRSLLPFGQVVALGRSQVCLQNPSKLKEYLQSEQPDIIVNAAAYTAVDKAETESDLAYCINAEAVAVLAEFAKKSKALLVHYSTDYVFDGENSHAYLETDETNPQNQYGKSKRAGELAIINSACKHLIFRTSWVFSSTGKNFINTIMQLAKEKTSLRVVGDQYGAPTSAELIADITALAIAAYKKGQLADGIYHLTASGTTNWHQLACYTVDKARSYGMPLELQASAIDAISTEEYPLPAKRPKNSQLNTEALASLLDIKIPNWKVYVDRMIEQLSRRESAL